MTLRRATEFGRLALRHGLQPTWGLATGLVALVGGSALAVVLSDPLWALIAVVVVLLLGAFEAWDAADRRAAAAEPNAARADLLEKRNAELSRAYALSQEQYKVFEGFFRENGR